MSDSEPIVSNAIEFSVSDLSNALKRTLEDRFGFVRVRGEISGYRGPHSSGHAYFSLKDANAKLDAIIWRGVFQRMKVKPQEGLEVIATGKISTFPGKSSYQILIETLEPAGVGALMALLDARRKALEAEGLFKAERKRPLPFLPSVVGVVTSPTGAVIRDILHRLADRFPLRVLVWPVRVQGETAAAEVAAAIHGFNALEVGGRIPRPDVLIVARGGGSLEDLWSFNEEIVVRAAVASRIPLIAAVGHETDWTLIDHAADLRAPTPTAAAELAVPVRGELVARVVSLEARALGAMQRATQRWRGDLRSLARALPSGEALLASARQRLDLSSGALRSLSRAGLDSRALRLQRASGRLSLQSPSARFATARERRRALDDRLTRAGAAMIQRFGEALSQAALARARETVRDAARRGDAFATLTRRWDQLATQQGRLQVEREARLAGDGERLSRAIQRLMRVSLDRLESRAQLLRVVSYKNVLARGFALVRDAEGKPIHRAAEAPKSGLLQIEFADSTLSASLGAVPRRKSSRGKAPDEQGSLL